ncbi:uncharacterized protein YndB with AHSA1/START domain [Sinobacterium caligoides]|uniref:Uncharacterized protein YndB with AHSA1/START domain n=1 Tax=Sinobacterium caligoides TaxID=933926 RepID=A0A3N2DHU2_9GAMM|nr:SRPBCC domain-containing protein [Sinobacterium caligoides]ROR98964.1 uncharacterized protein YndB with AHSA1/START domain [Sinobacterium caligoides]
MINEHSVYSDQVTINAPVSLVWQILIDFDNYQRWNPFCPQLINKSLAIGEAVDMQVELGHGLQQQVEYIENIEKEREISWSMTQQDKSVLYARRTQSLSAITSNSCDYLSVDYFEGALRDSILRQHGQAIEDGFNACAYGLKDYAEAAYRHSLHAELEGQAE